MAEIKQIKLPNGNTYDIYDVHALRKYHDLEINWEQQTDFIPTQGELIVYDIDNTHSYERLKIGDGTTNVNSLPFVVAPIRVNLGSGTLKVFTVCDFPVVISRKKSSIAG